MVRHHYLIAPTVALTLALAAAAPASARLELNPPPATAGTSTPASTNLCSEVCAGGGYGSVSQPSSTTAELGAKLPHDGRSRSAVLPGKQITNLAEIQQGAREAGLHPGVFGPKGGANLPATIVHVTAHGDGFAWGDAGIGAGAMLTLTVIGVGGALTLTNRRNRRIHDQPAS
jgi:hypothetical protein